MQADFIQDVDDFRLFLQRELLERCKKRPGYSLRAFSKALGMDSTALSRILSGKRKVTVSTYRKLFDRLGLSPTQMEHFTAGREMGPHKAKDKSQLVYSQLAHDTFLAMSNWYYMAILELPYLDDFQLDPKWMAKVLGITVSEVNIAIDTLKRLGLIEITEDGKWIDKEQFFSTIQPNLTSSALRAYQKQILAKAMEALDTTPIELRDQTALTFAVKSSRVEEAKERIKEFRRGMLSFMQDGDENDEVYVLTVGLFPVTDVSRKE